MASMIGLEPDVYHRQIESIDRLQRRKRLLDPWV